jgi:3-dehydroquinate synthase
VSELALRHPWGETAVRVAPNALERPADRLVEWLDGRLVFVVTQKRLLELHGHRLEALKRAAGEWRVLEVPDGEAAKRLVVAEELWRAMLVGGGKRDSRVLAFGGGTVGDLAGFVAGGFLRGIEYSQLPSTLLAQVDASIGGKTGVNLPEAKNSVGLFHHPAFVTSDTGLLATLPAAELRSGLFEVVKIAAIHRASLLGLLDERLEELLAADAGALAEVVALAARAKIEIVEEDPGESDRRRLLNFGHTVGHALEAHFGYEGLRHGEAVGYGMLFALRLGQRRGLEAASAERVRMLIRRIGLPELEGVAADGILSAIGRDKKARREGIAWVYPRSLGVGCIDSAIPESEVAGELAAFLADPWE